MTSHTPGPWRALRLNWGLQILPGDVREARKRPVIGTVTAWTDDKREDKIAEANANLIATAPDLLEAARQFVRYHAQVPSVPADPDNIIGSECVCGDCSRFKAAIAKAEDQL